MQAMDIKRRASMNSPINNNTTNSDIVRRVLERNSSIRTLRAVPESIASVRNMNGGVPQRNPLRANSVRVLVRPLQSEGQQSSSLTSSRHDSRHGGRHSFCLSSSMSSRGTNSTSPSSIALAITDGNDSMRSIGFCESTTNSSDLDSSVFSFNSLDSLHLRRSQLGQHMHLLNNDNSNSVSDIDMESLFSVDSLDMRRNQINRSSHHNQSDVIQESEHDFIANSIHLLNGQLSDRQDLDDCGMDDFASACSESVDSMLLKGRLQAVNDMSASVSTLASMDIPNRRSFLELGVETE